MFSHIAVAALVAVAAAAPYPTPDEPSGNVNPTTKLPEEYFWSVTHWVAGGASRSGSGYDFNVSAQYVEGKNGQPDGKAFLAYCSGTSPNAPDTANYAPCKLLEGGGAGDGLEVSAMLDPYDVKVADGVANIHVELTYTDSNGNPAHNPTVTYTYQGSYKATYNQFSGPPYDFKIVPDYAAITA